MSEEMAGRHYVAGCDDPLVGVRCGLPYVAFSREATSLQGALISAIADIERSWVGLELVASTPRVPFDHANRIRREVDECPHQSPL